MQTIAYLVYGDRWEYHAELSLSIASAMRFLRNSRGNIRFLLITDTEGCRPDLPIDYLVFTQAEFREWTRNGIYQHAAKVHALKKAMAHSDGPVVLLDTDTRFIEHPDKLFAMIGPGRSLMHHRETEIGKLDHWSAFLAAAPAEVQGYPINIKSIMNNSGVIGLHPQDISALDDAAGLIPSLTDIEPVFSIEQFAVTCTLSRHTEVGMANSVIDHFWQFHRRVFVHAQVRELSAAFTPEGFDALIEVSGTTNAPRAPFSLRLIANLKGKLFGWSGDYRFAYLAYRTALMNKNPFEARAWAEITHNALAKSCETPDRIKRDFKHLNRIYSPELQH